MNKRSFSRFTLLLALFSLVLAACGKSGGAGTPSGGSPSAASSTPAANASASSSAPAAKVPVKIILKWVPQAQFAGYFVAKEQGYYDEEGLDVTIIPGGPDIVGEQQVASGAADIGIDWVASLLPHQEQGLPLIQIAQIYQNSGLQLIAKKSSGIQTAADLKGKKVGNWMGGNEFEILALFDKFKMDPTKDVKFVKQGFTMDQFLNGELDAASAMTYNEYHVVLEQGTPAGDLNVIDMNAEGVAMLQDNLFANRDWLAKNKETAAKFVRASIKGWKEAIANPAAAVDMVMKSAEAGSSTKEHQLTMMQEVAKLVAPAGFDLTKMGFTDDAKFKKTADIALQFGIIKKAPNLQDAYTNEIMEMAAKK